MKSSPNATNPDDSSAENTEESTSGLFRLLGDLCDLCGLILARWFENLAGPERF